MRWKVRLTGSELGLQRLVKSFSDDPEIFVDDGTYYIRCSEFERLDSASEVRAAAKDLVQTIRTFGEKDSLHIENLEASDVHETREDGSTHLDVLRGSNAIVMSTSRHVEVVYDDGTTETIKPSADRTYERTQQSLEDEKVQELARIQSQGDSWVNLYCIYEYIQDNIDSDRNIIEQGWWSSGQKDSFKRTANSRGAIGDEARHGHKQILSPDEPMSHNEAVRFINELVDNWLQHRQER